MLLVVVKALLPGMLVPDTSMSTTCPPAFGL
jgi:hypothetical protein